MSCSGRQGRRRRGGGWPWGTDAKPPPRLEQNQVWCSDIWRQVCGSFGVPWNLVVVITVLTVLTATVTPGWCQEEPATTKECTVHPVTEDVATPGVRFSEAGVVVGLLPPVPGEVLAGLTFTVTTATTNTVLKVLKDDPKTLECWRGSYLRRTFKNLPSFATEKPYEWRHILVSLKDGKILLNNSLDVCPGVEVEGSNQTLVVSTLKRTNVAFNCREGCPIFRDSALAAYAHSGRVPGQELFVRGKSEEAKGQLQVIQCNGATNNVPVNGDRWQSVQLERLEDGRSMRLRVGEDFSKVLPQDGEKCPVFDFRASEDLLWAVGCDLRAPPTTAPPTPSAFLNMMKSPSNDQKLGLSSAWSSTPLPPCDDTQKPPPTRGMAAVVSGWMATGVMVVISVGLAAYIYMLKGENDRLRKDGDGWSISRGEIPLNVPLSLKFARDTPTPPGCVQTPRHTPKKQQQNGAPNTQDDFIVVHPRSAKTVEEPAAVEQPPAVNNKAFF